MTLQFCIGEPFPQLRMRLDIGLHQRGQLGARLLKGVESHDSIDIHAAIGKRRDVQAARHEFAVKEIVF